MKRYVDENYDCDDRSIDNRFRLEIILEPQTITQTLDHSEDIRFTQLSQFAVAKRRELIQQEEASHSTAEPLTEFKDYIDNDVIKGIFLTSFSSFFEYLADEHTSEDKQKQIQEQHKIKSLRIFIIYGQYSDGQCIPDSHLFVAESISEIGDKLITLNIRGTKATDTSSLSVLRILNESFSNFIKSPNFFQKVLTAILPSAFNSTIGIDDSMLTAQLQEAYKPTTTSLVSLRDIAQHTNQLPHFKSKAPDHFQSRHLSDGPNQSQNCLKSTQSFFAPAQNYISQKAESLSRTQRAFSKSTYRALKPYLQSIDEKVGRVRFSLWTAFATSVLSCMIALIAREQAGALMNDDIGHSDAAITLWILTALLMTYIATDMLLTDNKSTHWPDQLDSWLLGGYARLAEDDCGSSTAEDDRRNSFTSSDEGEASYFM